MTWIAAYLVTGALVGWLAGLLGIGGGMTLVPILSAMFTAQQFAPEHAAAQAYLRLARELVARGAVA